MNGLLLLADNVLTRQEAKSQRLSVTVATEPAIIYERTLIVGSGVRVPWDLVPHGFAFLDRWEVAAPLVGRVLAADLGTSGERERTQALLHDLRVPTYGELLFVRQCEAGEQLVTVWRDECAGGADRRLAFLRALYRVKPLLLALPRSWLQGGITSFSQPRRQLSPTTQLVHIQVAPGRSVCCRPEEAEMYRRRFAQARARHTS